MHYKNKLRRYLEHAIVRNSTYGMAEVAIPFILVLFATPFLINHMGAENYGLWNIALAFLGLIGIFDFGVGTAVIKYISEYYEQDNITDLSVAVTLSFGINILIGIFFGALLYLFSGSLAFLFRSSEVSLGQTEIILKVTSLGLFPMMLENVGLSVPRGFQDYRTPTTLLIIQNALTLLGAILIVFLGGSILQVMISTIIILWLVAVVSLYIGVKKLYVIGARPKFIVSVARKILRFIAFMGLTGIGIKIFTFLDRIVVGQVLGLSAVAYYTIATGVANKISALASAITQPLLPAFSSWGTKDDAKNIRTKFLQVTAAISIIVLLPGMLFLFLSRPIIFFWLGEKTGSAVLPALQILVFIYTVRIIASPAFQALNGLNFPQVTAFTALTAGIGTVILIYLLAPYFGIIGAAWANIASWVAFYTIIFLLIHLRTRDSQNG